MTSGKKLIAMLLGTLTWRRRGQDIVAGRFEALTSPYPRRDIRQTARAREATRAGASGGGHSAILLVRSKDAA